MKLLFDQNLSPKLLNDLPEEFAGSQHVRNIGLRDASDTEIWNYARAKDYVIVSKDADFHQRSFVSSHPPKVIGILGGNCPTGAIAALVRSSRERIITFSNNSEAAFLALYITPLHS
jgi:predicted nuclease of predicted toxin-antitoxin system